MVRPMSAPLGEAVTGSSMSDSTPALVAHTRDPRDVGFFDDSDTWRNLEPAFIHEIVPQASLDQPTAAFDSGSR